MLAMTTSSLTECALAASPTTLVFPELPVVKARSLTAAERYQLKLLLTQSMLPVKASYKGLMAESIKLADRLQAVGIRKDRSRPVMGMHLLHLWDETLRLGHSRSGGTAGIDLYIQSNFSRMAEKPHPLDTAPLQIPIARPSHAVPRLSFTAALPLPMPLPFGKAMSTPKRSRQLSRRISDMLPARRQLDGMPPPPGAVVDRMLKITVDGHQHLKFVRALSPAMRAQTRPRALPVNVLSAFGRLLK